MFWPFSRYFLFRESDAHLLFLATSPSSFNSGHLGFGELLILNGVSIGGYRTARAKWWKYVALRRYRTRKRTLAPQTSSSALALSSWPGINILLPDLETECRCLPLLPLLQVESVVWLNQMWFLEVISFKTEPTATSATILTANDHCQDPFINNFTISFFLYKLYIWYKIRIQEQVPGCQDRKELERNRPSLPHPKVLSEVCS